ncbi:hypothetical protein [Nostocoides vanveenii]|jgi:hypothetical protein|uniref:Cell division protein FtsL n=2 Tax=Nostocoides TaxID=99479 RepID=A0ABN2KS95_9MICO
MSQLHAIDVSPVPTRRPIRPTLTVVPSRYVARQFGFIVVLGVTLIVGLLAALMVNTALAKGTYVRGALVGESNILADRQEVLTHELDQLRAPAALATKALKLGMVPAQSPAFINLSAGTVVGVAQAAKSDKAFTVITAPTLGPVKGTKSAKTSAASKGTKTATKTTAKAGATSGATDKKD